MESGKSQRIWCGETGIKQSTLRYWLERLDELSEGEEIRFAKVVIGGEHDDSKKTLEQLFKNIEKTPKIRLL